MNIVQFLASFFYRIRYWLLWGSLLVTALVIYFTQFLPYSYTVNSSLYATDMAKGGVVYENDIPEVQSAYITISIANFPAEEYKLEITGTPSGHLTGYFTKE